MRPDEHCRLTVLSPDVFGIPAIREAARATVAPPPGVNTVPTAISSIKAGFIPDVLTTPFKFRMDLDDMRTVPAEYQPACPQGTNL